MKTKLLILVSAVSLTACGSLTMTDATPGLATQATGVVAQHQRITDEAVLADRRSIDGLQQRLRKLNESGVLQGNYSLAKAQCWLDTAATQYHENDRTGYIEESLAESLKIIKALEADQKAKVGYATPLVARSTLLRPDLWAQLEAYKQRPDGLVCNARTVACAEIRLIRAGHAEEQTGWRQALPHVEMAENAVHQASRQAAACVAPPPASGVAVIPPAKVVLVATTPVALSVPAAVPVPTPVVLDKQSFVLTSDALFEYKKFKISDLRVGGAQHLDGVAKRLAGYATIESLVVIGHTDRFGGDAYNDQLSTRRAQTVRDYLIAKGVKASQTKVIGRGKREPLPSQCALDMPASVAINCLRADRRVVIQVSGVSQ